MTLSHDDDLPGPNTATRYEKTYDEEECQARYESRWAWPKSTPRFFFPRKALIYLLFIDFVIISLLIHLFAPLITLLIRNEELFGARLTFHGNDSSPGYDPSSERRTIPRILHQTTANETVPEQWVGPQMACREAYSDYSYKLWTDASARELIATEFNWFLDTWDNYPFPIQRADALRYFVLYTYGGIYIDMDTMCEQPLPLSELESDGAEHHAVFKSTKPTGVSNDLMITSARHPVFGAAISKIMSYSQFTQPWARLQPYCAIMISAGPLFITMAIKNYLLENPTLPPTNVQVINATSLSSYITDLEAASWHHADAQTFMFIGDRPWIWFLLGAIGVFIGFHLINRLLMMAWGSLTRNTSFSHRAKVAKLI